MHLKDRYFCSPIIDEEAVKAKRERELAEEKEKVLKEYEERQKKKKAKEDKDKNKDADKDKDKDKDDKDDKKEEKNLEDDSKVRPKPLCYEVDLPNNVPRNLGPQLPRKKSPGCSNSRGWPAFPPPRPFSSDHGC